MKAFILIPQSSFRAELRSDTLWGLIIVALKYLYGDEKITEIIQSYLDGKPEFLISSAMLCKLDKDNKVEKYYFPKPIVKPFDTNELDQDELKKYKQVNLIDKETFEQFLNGEQSDLDYFKSLKWKEKKVKNGNNDKNSIPKIIEETLVKTTIDRLTGTTNQETEGGQLYTTVEKFLKEKVALYFLAEGDTTLIEHALRFLTHFGFGGDNSTGKGSFSFMSEDIAISQPSDAKQFVTLSLFSPRPEEIEKLQSDEDSTWYELVKRSGKIGNQFRSGKHYEKKPMLYFAEGSTFPAFSTNYGKLFPDSEISGFTVYQYGYAFKLSANFKE